MRVKCWKCKGRGRLRDEPLTSPWPAVVGLLGIPLILRALVEHDPDDDRWWHNCEICCGRGYQDEARP